MNFFLIDADLATLKQMKAMLEEAGHSVDCCQSSLRALREIQLRQPDCVITDIIMPEMDGFELCWELRRLPSLAALKIIICTSKAYDFDRRRAKELGANGYIIKPIDKESLVRSVADILSEQVTVHYWGVHGTLPTPGTPWLRYGGNTPCISLTVSGEPLYILIVL